MMPTTLTLATMASLLLLVRAVKQLRKAPSHTDNRLLTADRLSPVSGSAPAWGA
jgi:hypothetical protein